MEVDQIEFMFAALLLDRILNSRRDQHVPTALTLALITYAVSGFLKRHSSFSELNSTESTEFVEN